MSRLSEVQNRLEDALARLEQISGERARSVNQTKSARDAEFEIMNARCQALEDKARVVSERLDTAISRVRTLLEG
jgi:hypothetical protein